MARLPTVSDNVVLTQQARPSISPSDVSNPFRSIAEAFGEVGTLVQEQEIKRAAEAGSAGVYRDSAGELKVDLRPDWTKTGDAYNRAATQAYTARLAGDIRTKGTNLANEAQGNVDSFGSSWKGFSDTLLKGVPQEARGAVQQMLETEGQRLGLGVSEQKRQRDIRTFEGDIKAEIASLDDDMSALARGGGTGTQAYREKQAQLNSLWSELAKNPEFSVGEKEASIAVKRMESRHMGEAMVGHVEKTLQSGGIKAAQAEADRILTDTNLNLSPGERRQFHGLAGEAIRNWGAAQKTAAEPFVEKAKKYKALLDEGLGIDDPGIDETAMTLARAGKVTEALELFSSRARAKFLSGFKQSSNADQAGALERGVAAANSVGQVGSGAVDTVVNRIIGVESGGNATAQNPNSTAGGLGQFLDSTWLATVRQHRPDIAAGKSAAQILALKKDSSPEGRKLQREMTAAYTGDNAEYLTNRGVSTTPGKLYLAHFLGPAGAVQTAKADPSTPIVNIVGQDVVRANPFLAGMTAADVQAWADKKMGGAGQPQVDPETIKAMRTEVTADAKELWGDMKAGMEKNLPPSPDEVVLLSRQLALIDDQNFRTQVAQYFESAQGADLIKDMPADQAAAVISQLKANVVDGATIAQQDFISAVERGQQQREQALKADPVGYAVDRRIIDPVPALDYAAGPAGMEAGLAARQRGVDMLRARGDVGNVSALRPEDQQALSKFIQAATPAEQGALLGAMSRSLKPDTYMATMASLADKADTKAMAAAGALYQDNPEVAEGILRGRRLLRENAGFAPRETVQSKQEIDTILPSAVFGPAMERTRQQLLEAATARYADLSNLAGDTSGTLNNERMTQSVNEVTGGMLDFNGSQIVAPRYGMSQDDLDTVMANLSDRDLVGARTADGTQITANDVRNYGRLRAVSQGQYMVEFGDASAPSYAMDEPQFGDRSQRVGRGVYVLDLGNR